MDRREWLIRAFAGAGALTMAELVAACGRDGLAGGPVGVQLYTLRTLLDEDVPGTLRAVAGIGFREVELAGLHGLAPAEMREALDGAGLSAPSSHVALDRIRADMDGVITEAATLGHRYVVVPSAPLDQRPDGYRRLAGELDGFGQRLREAGMMVGYHNHDGELRPVDGEQRGLDILLEETDPTLVTFELDVYWTVHGGGDPMAYLRRYPGRFRLLHAKDRGPDGAMLPVGAGSIDWAALLPAFRARGLEHLFVEHDDPADPVVSIRASHAYLTGR